MGDVHASEPREDEEPKRFEFETGQALRRNQSGLGRIVAKTRNEVIDMESSRFTGARIESVLHGPRRRLEKRLDKGRLEERLSEELTKVSITLDLSLIHI